MGLMQLMEYVRLWNPRSPYLFCSSTAFIFRNLLYRPLNLDEINRAALQVNRIAQDGLDLSKLVLVASDEVELTRGHF